MRIKHRAAGVAVLTGLLAASGVAAALPAQAACPAYSGLVCIYRDKGGGGPQNNTNGAYWTYTAHTYIGTTTTLNDTASRFENRSANGNYRVRIYYDAGYQLYFGCVNPGSNWDLPGGGWGDYPGDGRNPDDNASSHNWAQGSSVTCA